MHRMPESVVLSNMSHAARSRTVMLVLALGIALTAGMSTQVNAAATEGSTAKVQKHKKKKKIIAPTYYEDTTEPSFARERRLRRECKGRPNAGACEGYTR